MVVFWCLFCIESANADSVIDEYPNVDNGVFGSLAAGESRSVVEGKLGSPGSHQFTAAMPNRDVLCVSYYQTGSWGEYYCVFFDSKLALICKPPPMAMKKVSHGLTSSIRRIFGDPEDRVSAVLRSDNLIGEPLRAELRAVTPKSSAADDDQSRIMRFIGSLVDPLVISKKRRELERLVELFDPFKVELGAAVSDVELRLGAPLLIEPYGDEQEIRYYGSLECSAGVKLERVSTSDRVRTDFFLKSIAGEVSNEKVQTELRS
jgi:hypothetical protein